MGESRKLIDLEQNGYTRFVCPVCGATVLTVDNENVNEDLKIEVTCLHCGSGVYYVGEPAKKE